MTDKPNLDLLRSVAVLLVLFDHLALMLGGWNPGWIGVFGVYLFFVHTSLVLMWSLERKPHTLDFYLRRVFRIYPLAAAATLIATAYGASHMVLGAYTPSLRGVLSNLLLIQNISRGGGYALGVMWSLPLEVDMYLFLPLLFFFVRKNLSLWPLLLLWSFLAAIIFQSADTHGNTLITVVPCFLPGIMAYVLYSTSRPRLPAWLFPVFLALLMAAYLHFSNVVASWPACLALGLALPFFRQIQTRWLRRSTHILAKYSYGIYLTHPLAFTVAFVSIPHLPLAVRAALGLGLTALFAFTAYHLVEHPMIELGRKVAARAERSYERHQASAAPSA